MWSLKIYVTRSLKNTFLVELETYFQANNVLEAKRKLKGSQVFKEKEEVCAVTKNDSEYIKSILIQANYPLDIIVKSNVGTRDIILYMVL